MVGTTGEDGVRPGIHLKSLEDQKNPYPLYAQLRDHYPVCQLEPDGMWAVSRYSDVLFALQQPDLFSSSGLEAALQPEWLAEDCKRDLFIVTRDPPDHTKYRALLNKAFIPAVINALEPLMRQTAQALAKKIRPDVETDFLQQFAYPYVGKIIVHIVGTERDQDLEDLGRWLDLARKVALSRPDDQYIQAFEVATRAQYALFNEVIRDRRKTPRQDLVSALVNAEIDGERLAEHDLRNALDLLLEAGFQTSLQMLCHAVIFLSRRGDIRRTLAASPDLIPDFIEELLRLESVGSSVLRTTTQPVTLSGVTIPGGATVMLLLSSANRDPSQFSNPDELDLTRDNIKQHIAFGYGPHICLGLALARLEIRIALEAILEAFDDMDCPSKDDLTWIQSSLIHAVEGVPVVFRRNSTNASVPRSVGAVVALSLFGGGLFAAADSVAAQYAQPRMLEEVIVTAQKREGAAQDTPIAISVLNDAQLETFGISSLDRFDLGVIPSLRVQPFGNTPSTLTLAIRGNGPTDIGQVTRDGPVAVYLDGIYLGRAQGLSMELVDLQRIEVLRGPQGTLFGRNATGGAVNMISKKPSGEFGIRQTLEYGRFDAFRSVTRIDLPEVAGIRAKVDYVHAQRDGWVDNTAPGQADFNAFNKEAARVALNWRPSEALEFDYSFNYADTAASLVYFQLAEDNVGIIGVEPGRQRRSRFPIEPIEPTVTEHMMHAFTAAWHATDNLTVKSLTSYADLREDTRSNFGGALYFNGLVVDQTIEQDQWSQELQLIGATGRFEWVAGLYYFEENVRDLSRDLFSLDIFGFLTGTPLTPIIPPTIFDVFIGADSPVRDIDANAKSRAVYGQVTWTPPVLDDRLRFDVGLRYTNDERKGSRTDPGLTTFDLNTDEVDPSIAITVDWTESISTYAKWSTAYKAGGVSPRSASFLPYLEEEAETFEIGLKSEFWDRRARLNAALFATDYDGLQINFSDPVMIAIVETINAANTVQIDGFEIDLTVIPIPGLVVGLSYTYLDGDMPLQPNPLAGGALERFSLVQTPDHAGAVTVDYTFQPWAFGTMTAHLDVTSTDRYAFIAASIDEEFFDAYTLVNARLTLDDIPLGKAGSLAVSVWGRNLTDEAFLVLGFPIGPAGKTQAFGTPRTVGFTLSYTL